MKCAVFWGAKGAPILFSEIGFCVALCSYIYVIVIVRLVCDMAQTQHEARGREAPEGECCVWGHIAH